MARDELSLTGVPELSIIAPCYNEQGNICRLVSSIAAGAESSGVSVELILVDDGSADETWERILEASRSQGFVVPVRHKENQGMVAAWRSGLSVARGPNSVFFDADMQYQPSDIFSLYEKLMSVDADIVQGTRSMIGRRKDMRWLVSRTLNTMLNLAFRHRSRDSKSDFIVGPTFALADVLDHRLDYAYFQTFVSVAARAKGYTIHEVDAAFTERRSGRSFLTGKVLRVSLRAALDFWPAMREFGWKRQPYLSSVAPLSTLPPTITHPYSGWRRVLFEIFFATMPAHKWMITRSARRLYLELKACERMSRAELDQLQTAKLRRLILHAYNNVPLYRERMREAGVAPHDVIDGADLHKVPLLSKADVRRHLYFDLFAGDHNDYKLHKITTSGSTGEPLTTYADRFQLEMRFATTLRGLEWTGWRFGDRQARLWHQTLGMTRLQVIREYIDAWFMRRLFIPAFEISPENIDDFVGRIRRHEPVLVDGYAESLNFLAGYVLSGSSAGFTPTAVMSSAQALPERTRRAIETGFSTRVFDKYGSREFSGIAYQCEASDNHHVMDESYVVEILVDGRPARPGETGEVVITDLNNFSVPLIRYRIGDLAVEVDQTEPCPCGRGSRRLGAIQGRTQAIVHCADGTWIPGTFFAHFFKDYDTTIKHFQVVQQHKGAFQLRCVMVDGATSGDLSPILDHLRDYVGRTEIGIDIVSEIPMGRTGKRSPVVSTVEQDFQDGPGEQVIRIARRTTETSRRAAGGLG